MEASLVPTNELSLTTPERALLNRLKGPGRGVYRGWSVNFEEWKYSDTNPGLSATFKVGGV